MSIAMAAGNWFWIIYVVSLIFCSWIVYPYERRSAIFVVFFVLIGLLGYHVFHSPLD
jgi:hypothetical protein